MTAIQGRIKLANDVIEARIHRFARKLHVCQRVIDTIDSVTNHRHGTIELHQLKIEQGAQRTALGLGPLLLRTVHTGIVVYVGQINVGVLNGTVIVCPNGGYESRRRIERTMDDIQRRYPVPG